MFWNIHCVGHQEDLNERWEVFGGSCKVSEVKSYQVT